MRDLETSANRAGATARARGAYGRGRVMTVACAMKPPHPAVMPEFAPNSGLESTAAKDAPSS